MKFPFVLIRRRRLDRLVAERSRATLDAEYAESRLRGMEADLARHERNAAEFVNELERVTKSVEQFARIRRGYSSGGMPIIAAQIEFDEHLLSQMGYIGIAGIAGWSFARQMRGMAEHGCSAPVVRSMRGGA